jgi:bifunctional UDP-N-acetylglucosamine pyrophosphorylase/glucosamine-1-phosphate N-acetyltransferase
MSQEINVVILAAGKGTRMRSKYPKVLHKLAGKSLLERVYDTASQLNPSKIIVIYGHGGDLVREALSHLDAIWVEQKQQMGTGHALKQAMPFVTLASKVLVLYGDVPLTRTETLKHVLSAHGNNQGTLALLTATLEDPTGYGRIIRNASNHVTHIVEQKDANERELEVCEVNTGILAADATVLTRWLEQLKNDNAQREYYLTDIIAMAVADGFVVSTSSTDSPWEMLGVNDRKQLADLERHFQLEQANNLLKLGLTLADPSRFDVRGNLSFGQDCIVDVNCVFEGHVQLGNDVEIGANCSLRDVKIGDNVRILPNSVIEEAVIGNECDVGPFARIRPGTVLDAKVKIGNFVEIKKAEVGEDSKINHLSYVGDAFVGKRVNIGAGTITCNYDGANKHVTRIGNDVFVGSDTQLVAPVTLGDGSTIGAGSTITRDTPTGELTLSRPKQVTVTGWVRPVKKPK